jgi:hypothetical protein
MKHPSTRRLFDYWNEQRGGRPAPQRIDIDPAQIRHVLGDTYMLAADFVDELRFRLAGTRVCALFCREIKGESFTALWNEASRTAIEELTAGVVGENVGALAGAIGRASDGSEVDLEMLLLPIAHTGHARIRALGALMPVVPPYWLGERPVTELELVTLRHITGEAENLGTPHFGTSPHRARLRNGFVVHNGGREAPSGGRTG